MKNRKQMRKIGTFFLRIKEIIDYIAIVGVFYILLYQIEVLRDFCKAICEYFIEWFLPIGLSDIRKIYLGFERLFRLVIILALIAMVLSAIIRVINEKRTKNKCGEDRFEKSLFRYLHDTAVPRCFLITGQWGSGKSYELKQFLDNYYNYTKTQVYRVSCFGLSSRKELIEEINNIIEQNDKTLYAQIMKVLQYVPIIGEAINKFFKKSYGYDSIDMGSIFIFEDFERITSRPITNEYSGRLYEKARFSHYAKAKREYQEITDEFEAVEKAFTRIEDFVNKNSLREDYDKYIAIVGFINELIEVYGMKAIIVCNTDILGEKFVHDVLRSKLNCLEYKKVITSETKESIIGKVFESRIFDDAEKQKCIENYFNLLKENIESLSWDAGFKDMRLFGGLLEAFIYTAILFDKEMLTLTFLNSMLNSIMIMHLGYYKNSAKELGFYVNGADIEFMIQLYGGVVDTKNLIRLPGCNENIKWVDVSVSGYWILSLSVPEDIKEIYTIWKNYKYTDLERKILDNPQCLIQEDEYNLIHVLYYQRRLDKDSSGIWEYRTYIEKSLLNYELEKIEVVNKILYEVYQIFGGRIYQDFENALFEILAKGKAEGTMEGDTFVHGYYREYLEKR